MQARLTLLRWTMFQSIERLQFKAAWLLPRWLVYFAVIRCGAHGTTGIYGNTEPDKLSIMEALRRWDTP